MNPLADQLAHLVAQASSLSPPAVAQASSPPALPHFLLASATEAAEHEPWLTHFSQNHAVVLLVAAAWTALVIWIGHRLRAMDRRRNVGSLKDSDRTPSSLKPQASSLLEPNYRRTLGAVGLAFAAVYHIYWLTPPRFHLVNSLPLHLCDILSVLAPVSMLLPRRLLLTLTYFWGVGLSILGLIIPVETAGPHQLRFWIFWVAHVQIVGIGLYHLVVTGYRPRAQDLLTAIAAGAVYAIPIVALNEIYGLVNETEALNYGYLGSRERQPFPVSTFGPWPLRLLPMAALAAAGFTLLWLPWGLRNRHASRKRSA